MHHYNVLSLNFHVFKLIADIMLYTDFWNEDKFYQYLVDKILDLIMLSFPDREPPTINILYGLFGIDGQVRCFVWFWPVIASNLFTIICYKDDMG